MSTAVNYRVTVRLTSEDVSNLRIATRYLRDRDVFTDRSTTIREALRCLAETARQAESAQD